MLVNVYLCLVLALTAAICVRLGAVERSGGPFGLYRIFLPALAASVVVVVLLIFHLDNDLPNSMFGVALAAGLLAGVARGLTMPLKIDHMWNMVKLERTPDVLCVSLLLALAVGIEIADVFAQAVPPPYRLATTLAAVLCLSLLTGRAVATVLRVRHIPHTEF
jgi:hypothetical protein